MMAPFTAFFHWLLAHHFYCTRFEIMSDFAWFYYISVSLPSISITNTTTMTAALRAKKWEIIPQSNNKWPCSAMWNDIHLKYHVIDHLCACACYCLYYDYCLIIFHIYTENSINSSGILRPFVCFFTSKTSVVKSLVQRLFNNKIKSYNKHIISMLNIFAFHSNNEKSTWQLLAGGF